MPLSDFYDSMKGWQPAQTSIEQKPGIITTPIGPSQNQVGEVPSSPYLRTSLPLPLQYAPDTLKQSNRIGLSSFRIAPLPPGGIPAINSAASSVSQTTVVETVNTTAAGPNGAIQFNGGGTIGGVSQLEWNNATSTVSIIGNVSITGSIVLSGSLAASIFNASTGFEIGGTAILGNYLRGNGTNFVSSPILVGDLPTGYPWSSLGNATANLTLANSTFNTTFQQTTPSAQWSWINTTAATSGANQASPVLAIQGEYWTGSVSAVDTWTIQDVLGGGANPSSSLSINHSGSSGTASVSIGPNLSVSGNILGAQQGIFTGAVSASTLTATAATPTGAASALGLGNTTGFGTGAAGTAVTTTTKGAGTGPTTPQTVVNYLEIDLGGTKFWVPLVQ